MNPTPNADMLTGHSAAHLVRLHPDNPHSPLVHPAVREPLLALQRDAAEAGFELWIASSYRSFERQLAIWNEKAEGRRRVVDDWDRPVDMAALTPEARMHAILRFSALPGTSRHHWGTDVDVYDRAVVPEGYHVQLTPEESLGLFGAFHHWLDQRMAAGASHGFFRCYAEDRGGVVPEPWHLSHAPTARAFEQQLSPALLQETLVAAPLALKEQVLPQLEPLFERYVRVPLGWSESGGAATMAAVSGVAP